VSRVSDIQRCLVGVLDFTQDDVDGLWGPHSQRTFDYVVKSGGQRHLLVGDGTWDHIKAYTEGNDIVLENIKVTAFGGASDNMDDGQTASGINTAKSPDILGCALPLRRDSLHSKSRGYILRGSPVPFNIPWQTLVKFTDLKTGKTVTTALIDIGPAKWTRNGGDMTVAAARQIVAGATANNFGPRRMNARIIGGAAFA
jgi:hypothetical protein